MTESDMGEIDRHSKAGHWVLVSPAGTGTHVTLRLNFASHSAKGKRRMGEPSTSLVGAQDVDAVFGGG